MIVLLGKNGSGKTYLAKELKKKGYNYTPNYTTRPKRENEIDDVDYKFVTKEEFEYLLSQGFFVEYKTFGGNYYGTPISKLAKDTITIGGNLNVLNEHSENEIQPVFIYSDIVKRFQRMMARKSTKQEIFMRMQAENFEYLDDFNAIFIDNSHEEGLTLLTNVIDISGSVRTDLIMSNHNFLASLTDEQDVNQNEFLNFLRYEEMLLISMSRLLHKFDEKCLFDYYVNSLEDYAYEHDITFVPYVNRTFSLTCDGQMYQGKFLSKKIKKDVK